MEITTTVKDVIISNVAGQSLKKSLARKKYKNKLEKLWKNFRENLAKVKVLNIVEIREINTVNVQKKILQNRNQILKY